MLLGAAYAGIAIENSMLGIAHSLANPLTAHFGIVHGQAVGIMLPHVIRFNAEIEEAAQAYKELAVSIGLSDGKTPIRSAAENLAEYLAGYLTLLAEATPSLAAYGVSAQAIPELAAEAATQRTAQFNPRVATQDDFATLYRAAL
jgi:alcohol dehydrogenase